MSENGKSVLVTGGAGYVGCVLVPALLARGYRVRVFDKLIFGVDGLRSVADRIELVQGDVTRFDAGVLADMDTVVHLAALSNDPTAEYQPTATHLINVDGTRQVADAAKSAGIGRFVYASSCSVYYSENPHADMLDETVAVDPQAAYSKSKIDSERLLAQLADDRFCPVFLRKGTIFGYSPRMRFDLVMNAFARCAFDESTVRVFNGGEMWRPLLDIKDAADAYINAIELPEQLICGRAFNVLHKNYRVLELAHWIKYVLRDKRHIDVQVQYQDGQPLRSYQVSGERFRDVFGYSPVRGISQALLELWERFENGDYSDFSNPEYYNITWFKLLISMQTRLAGMGPVLPSVSNGLSNP